LGDRFVIQFARRVARLERPPMGSKYVPTVKDQKADRRFHDKQLRQSKFIKPSAPRPPAKKKSK